MGGRDPEPNDGAALLGAPVVTPHYAALIASLRPDEAIHLWTWLIANGLFTPLNNAESLIFPPGAPCDRSGAVWNQGKLSWNLALQTLACGAASCPAAGLGACPVAGGNTESIAMEWLLSAFRIRLQRQVTAQPSARFSCHVCSHPTTGHWVSRDQGTATIRSSRRRI